MNLNSEVTAALIGALIAGILAFVVGWAAHHRDTRRRDVEWSREKVLECYSNCVYYLVKLSISSTKKSTDDKDVRQHFSEAQRYLILLSAYHRSDPMAVVKLNQCNAALCTVADKTAELSAAADSAVEIVKSLMEKDKRVQVSH